MTQITVNCFEDEEPLGATNALMLTTYKALFLKKGIYNITTRLMYQTVVFANSVRTYDQKSFVSVFYINGMRMKNLT